MAGKYWLMKSEAGCYSIDDLKKDKQTFWDGVRNYQARNFLRDEIKKGDGVLFYHSNGDPSGIVGVAEVVKEGAPDPTQWDPQNEHFDPKSSPHNPLWYGVTVAFKEKFSTILPLDYLKKDPLFKNLLVIKKGARLSIQPVTPQDFNNVKKLAKKS